MGWIESISYNSVLQENNTSKGQKFATKVKHLVYMCEVLGLIPVTANKYNNSIVQTPLYLVGKLDIIIRSY